MPINGSKSTGIITMLHLLIIAFLVINIYSCKNADEKKETTKKQEASMAPSCMTLVENQLDDWFPRYGKPSNPVAQQITVLKFYPDYNPSTGNYDMTVRAFNSTNTQVGNELTLNEGVACAQNLPSLLSGISYDIELSKLNILKNDGSGSLVDNFVKLILTPAEYPLTGYVTPLLKFTVEVRIGDDTQTRPDILPCPPCQNCRPIPDDCDTKIDTTQSQKPVVADTVRSI